MKKLGFGLMRLPCSDGRVDEAVVERMADLFLERGFTYFDTAYVYHDGHSEEVFERTVAGRHPRDAYTIATKLPLMGDAIATAADQERIFAEQLARCRVDCFDYYLLHCLTEEVYAKAQRLDSFGFAARAKRDGKAVRIGFSFHDSADLLDRILTEHPEVDFVQLQINYRDWESPEIQSRRCYETAVRHGKPVIVMEPVKGGTLARLPERAERELRACRPDDSPASWALRFAAGLENVQVVLSGMSDLAQMEENTALLRDFRPLSPDERAALQRAEESVRAEAVACTACGYCLKGCPKGIPIPDWFRRYNDFMRSGAQRAEEIPAGTAARASDCLACGQCERVCPQHLRITEYLKDVARALEG